MKEKSLEDCLAEVDQWKATVTSRSLPLTHEERAAQEDRGLAWLEAQLGRKLKRAPRRQAKTGAKR